MSPPDIAAAAAHIVGQEYVESGISISDASSVPAATVGALARPADASQVRELVTWAYASAVPMIPVGGQTGLSGGVVPSGDAGEAPALAISLSRLNRVRSLEPLLWRMEVEAGLTTASVRRLARENGLLFPPDPGAAESSQIGGNLATNAGGPHAFKYGVISHWVTGIEAVIAPGELVRFGGPIRKDAAGYDLRGMLIGSEGTLGIITAAWLRLIPAPGQSIPVAAGYESVQEGVEAIHAAMASDVVPSAIEYFQGTSLRHAPPPFLDARRTQFLVICDAESETERDALLGALGPEAATYDPAVVWRWREGVSLAVRAASGEKLSEDIAVPLDRIQAAIEGTLEIGARHGLEACSWGHAGDGNLHSTFLFDPRDAAAAQSASDAAEDLFELARALGGTVSGEHGLGLLKRGQLVGQWSAAAIGAHEAIKTALDPKGLFNPGKKLARVS